MPLPSNDKQVGDIGHADDHNSIVNEINTLISASSNYLPMAASANYLTISASSNFLPMAASANYLRISASSNFATATISINAQTVTSYTLQISDIGKLITMNNSSENAVVIPLNSTTAFRIGSNIDIIQVGSGTSSVTFVDGVTLDSESSKKTLNSRYSAETVVKLDTNSWILIGALKT